MNETRILASYVVKNRWEDIPEDVRHEGKRALINVIGCAIGGSRLRMKSKLTPASRPMRLRYLFTMRFSW